MNAVKQITEILTACGCKPAVKTDDNGNATVKINAPALEFTTLFDPDAAEWEYMQEKEGKTK